MPIVIIAAISLEEVEAQIGSAPDLDMIFYGARTCWWTHDRRHVRKQREEPHLPCDPRSGVLFQTDEPGKFIRLARDNADRYGKYGLATFLAAHHLNCRVEETMFPTCLTSWAEYEALLDAQGGKPLTEFVDRVYGRNLR